MLDDLIPKVVELMKSTVGLGTRIACAHFVNLLVVQLGADVTPYSGKLLSTLVNGLTDRNSAVRKHNAVAIGHLVGVCKTSSLEKLFAKLQLWYFEREGNLLYKFVVAFFFIFMFFCRRFDSVRHSSHDTSDRNPQSGRHKNVFHDRFTFSVFRYSRGEKSRKSEYFKHLAGNLV